jgi:predicted negative regulator of RcsB-dependent stress response
LQVEDLSDLEREEQLRSFWGENWLMIVGGIAIGLGGIAGWRYWQGRTMQRAEQAEAGYSAVVDALTANQREQAVTQAKTLRETNPASPYADQADLALARAAVDRREFDEAARLLRVVMDGSRDAELRRLARTRLARVLVEQGKHDEAVGLLEPADGGAFTALYHEIRGDALAAKGDPAGARREYESALAADDAQAGIDRDFVALKRDALPAVAAAEDATR